MIQRLRFSPDGCNSTLRFNSEHHGGSMLRRGATSEPLHQFHSVSCLTLKRWLHVVRGATSEPQQHSGLLLYSSGFSAFLALFQLLLIIQCYLHAAPRTTWSHHRYFSTAAGKEVLVLLVCGSTSEHGATSVLLPCSYSKSLTRIIRGPPWERNTWTLLRPVYLPLPNI